MARDLAASIELEDLRRSERSMQLVRWVGVVFAVVQISLYKTLPYPPGVQRTGYALAAALGIANIALRLASRRSPGSLIAARTVAAVGLGIDTLIISGFVWLYTFDPSSSLWAVLFILPLGAAIRFRMVGALSVWGGVTVLYAIREIWGSQHYGYPLAPESISFRMGLALLIAIVGGLIQRDLYRQRMLAEQASRRYQSLVEGMDAIVWERDPATLRFTYVSQEAERTLGYPVSDWLASPDFWRSRVHPDELDRALQHVQVLRTDRSDSETEYRMIAADGRNVWLYDVAKIEHDDEGREQIRGIMVDVSVRKQAEAALRESEERFRTAFNAAGSGMALVGIDGRFLRVNHELSRITGYSEDELLASSFLAITHPDDQPTGRALVRRMLAGGHHTFLVEARYLHKSAAVVWVLISASLVHDDNGRPTYFIAQVQDISDRKRAEEFLEHQALHDPLTGLPNRSLLMDRLQQAVVRGKRTGQMAAVLFLDLDRFKLVNDSLGHDAGDQLLMATAKRLQSVLRPQDTAARFGGDEFVIVVEDVASVEDVNRVAERVHEVLATPFVLPDGEAYLTASIGIALSRVSNDSPDSLLRDADSAMYRAKEKGKARHELFDEVLRERAAQRLRLVNSLHRAQERGEFKLLYQPIVDLSTNKYVAVEGLLRWEQGRALVPAAEFLQLAEETGLIVPIGNWALAEACKHAGQWNADRGRDQPPLQISVNLSGRQLSGRDATKTIADILSQAGCEPSNLRLEISEHALMADAAVSIEVLGALRAMGVKIFVDDFGTGYSSLNYLRQFRVDAIKVHQSFVEGLGQSREDTAIVQAIVSMAKALDLMTVAVGVETAQQVAHLRALGCDQAQGFYFDIPAEAEAVRAVLSRGPTLVLPEPHQAAAPPDIRL